MSGKVSEANFGKIEEQLPKKSVGLHQQSADDWSTVGWPFSQFRQKSVSWLLSDSWPELVFNLSANFWLSVNELLVNSLPTDDRQIFGELFFNLP